MIVSGVSGNATFDQQKRFPFMFNGHSLKLDYTKTFYELKLQQTSGGTISGSPVSGESGTKFNLSATPDLHYHIEGYSAEGASLTGSSGTYINSDVSAKGIFAEDPKYTLTVQQSTGGTLAGSPTSGYSGDTFNLTATPNTHFSFASYSVTGTTMTGNTGEFKGANVTAKANWTEDPKYTLSLQQTTGGTLASNKTSGYQNDTFTLTPTPANKYTFSAYQTTGTTMTGNNGKFNTSNVTAKAVWEYHPSETTAYVAKPYTGEDRYTQYMAGVPAQSASVCSGWNFKNNKTGYPVNIGFAAFVSQSQFTAAKSIYDNSYVQRFVLYPTFSNSPRYAEMTNLWTTACGDYYASTAYYDILCTKSAKFANNRTLVSAASDGNYYRVPYGFSLNNSAYIKNFSARIPVGTYTDNYGVSQYRVIMNGTVGPWIAAPTGVLTYFVTITAAKLTDSKIEIECSSRTSGAARIYTSIKTSAVKVSTNNSAFFPSWTGNMCYLE